MSESPMEIVDLQVVRADNNEVIIRGVNLTLQPGRVFALVGESGSGKSVTSLAAMRLLPDGLRISGGRVSVGGQDLFPNCACGKCAVGGWR